MCECKATINKTAQFMPTASARIGNAIRSIERECSTADDPVIKKALFELATIAGDINEIWAELDLFMVSDGSE